MLTENLKKASLRVESENGLAERQSLKGVIFRAGKNDFEFSSDQSWEGKSCGYVAFRAKSSVGSLNVRRRADGCLRLILTTPSLNEKLTPEQFRKMEEAVAAGMDYIFKRLMNEKRK